MNILRVFSPLCVPLVLAGCISGSVLTLEDIKSGKVATGTISRLTHTATINLNGKEYSGEFNYVQRANTEHGLMAEESIVSDGKMTAKADDGSSLICEATIWGWSNSGNGKCHDDDQNTYDLLIATRY